MRTRFKRKAGKSNCNSKKVQSMHHRLHEIFMQFSSSRLISSSIREKSKMGRNRNQSKSLQFWFLFCCFLEEERRRKKEKQKNEAVKSLGRVSKSRERNKTRNPKQRQKKKSNSEYAWPHHPTCSSEILPSMPYVRSCKFL